MFGLAAGLYQSYFSPTQLNILLIGEEGVGKTALLERIKVTHFVNKREVIWNERVSVPVPKGDETADRRNTQKRVKHPKQPNGAGLLAAANSQNHHHHQGAVVSMRRNLIHRIACPAPPRYHHAASAEEEEEEEEEEDDDNNNNSNNNEEETCDATDNTESTHNSSLALPPPQPISERRSSQESMESVDMGVASSAAAAAAAAEGEDDEEEERPNAEASPTVSHPQEKQYDIKPHVKMLPLDKIRPTSGMNLAKVEIGGCKCHVWDLGGRFQSLWERYYGDCDAVIFVVQVQDILKPKQAQQQLLQQQQPLKQLSPSSATTLERVRSSIADDIPFLILGHVKPPQQSFTDALLPDVMYSTESLLPHYHNPMTAMFMANAATGQGVRSAIEWLVPLAKRQKPLREQLQNNLMDNGK